MGDPGGAPTDDEANAGTDTDADVHVLDELFAVIEQRREELPDGSYTASLFAHEKGENRVLEKIGEETTEVVLAAKDGDDDALVAESADLVYHLFVLLAAHGKDLDDLRAELADR